jgi:hypothetical protein
VLLRWLPIRSRKASKFTSTSHSCRQWGAPQREAEEIGPVSRRAGAERRTGAPATRREVEATLKAFACAAKPSRGGGVLPDTSTAPITFRHVFVRPPTGPGEMVRFSLAIGELVSRAFKGIAPANQRRREATARRVVEAALKAFADAAKPR